MNRSASHTSSKIIWYHLDDPRNIGDQVCCPLDYFDLPGQCFNLREGVMNISGDAIIFGGGGLFHEAETEKIGRIAQAARSLNPSTKLIAWGLGANQHGRTGFEYPEFIREFDLVGIRDFGNPWEYVPCASCVHPAFDTVRTPPIFDYVIYEHHRMPIPLSIAAPSLNNNLNRRLLGDVIAHLLSAEVVITNSFHGVYWSLLLGRKVLIFKPFSNRFYGFSRRVVMCDESNWRERMREAQAHEDYLDECRAINHRFARRVRELLF